MYKIYVYVHLYIYIYILLLLLLLYYIIYTYIYIYVCVHVDNLSNVCVAYTIYLHVQIPAHIATPLSNHGNIINIIIVILVIITTTTTATTTATTTTPITTPTASKNSHTSANTHDATTAATMSKWQLESTRSALVIDYCRPACLLCYPKWSSSLYCATKSHSTALVILTLLRKPEIRLQKTKSRTKCYIMVCMVWHGMVCRDIWYIYIYI